MNAAPEIVVGPSVAALHENAAQIIVRQAVGAVETKGRFTIVLSGGETPRGLYALLASDEALRAAMPWARTHVFWGDERQVPPDHAESNYRMAFESLLSKVPVPAGQIHRILGEKAEARLAAQAYETTLRTSFEPSEGVPRFDLVLLGMGSDGHTASLFPGTRALEERSRLAMANWVGKLFTERITLTTPVLNEAALVVFLIAGTDKALALKGVLEGPYEPEQLPAQIVRPRSGRLVFVLDTGAASLLRAQGPEGSAVTLR